MAQALLNARVLLTDGFASDCAVVIDGERISAIVATDDSSLKHMTTIDLGGDLLLPGFIDTQVNGGGGALFNAAPTLGTIERIGRAHRRFGTTGFLPTLISDDLSVVATALAAVQQALLARTPGVLGIHIEGPFLSAVRHGIHDPAKLRNLDDAAIELLTSLRGGRTLVTLAPETTTLQRIANLAAAGVIVAAGHTDSSYGVIRAALQHGLRGFTHLFNAMSQLHAREPGTVGAALEDQDSWCGIIVDGHHVDPAVLRLALRCKRADRFMLVTDAMPSVGTNDSMFELQGRRITVQDNICLDEDGTLAGSDMDMASAVRNAVTMLGIDLPLAVRMASEHPAQFLGIADDVGRIAPGCRANLVRTDDRLNVRNTWIDGVSDLS